MLGKKTFLLATALFLSAFSWGGTIYVPDDHSIIQDAIQAAMNGDTIIVRPGTYVENIDFLGKAVVLQSELGPEATIIDGSQLDCVVLFENGEGIDSVLDGFTITNGVGLLDAGLERNGGGIACVDSSPTIMNNIITGNDADRGGGIICFGGSAVVSNNVIRNNTSESGGGIFNYNNSTPLITGNTIQENSARATAGGINTVGADPVIMNNLIRGNTVAFAGDGGGLSFHLFSDDAVVANNVIVANAVPLGAGGGIYCYQSSPKIMGNIIARNLCLSGGGGIRVSWNYTGMIANNTVVANQASEGGGFWCNNSQPTVVNTILWNNTAGRGKEIYLASPSLPSTLDISHSLVHGGHQSAFIESGCTINWGVMLIDADPLFVDPDHFDYHLCYTSPCIDVGNKAVPDLPELDFEGDPRITFNRPDMGADEFHTHLYSMGYVVPGQNVQVRIIGLPGATRVFLMLGKDVLDPPSSTNMGLLYLNPSTARWIDLGAMPAEGIINYSFAVPWAWSSGEEYPFQSLVGAIIEPHAMLTNLMMLEVE